MKLGVTPAGGVPAGMLLKSIPDISTGLHYCLTAGLVLE